MNIAGYRFGRIDIDGRTYTSDVIITPERVIDSWWRQRGMRCRSPILRMSRRPGPTSLLRCTSRVERGRRLPGDGVERQIGDYERLARVVTGCDAVIQA